MKATFSIEKFNFYEKVIVQFLTKGKGIFNTTGFKIEFLPNSKMILYYTGSKALASYTMECVHDMHNKIISTDYFRFTQILKALAFEGQKNVSFILEETETGLVIKIDNTSTHIDLPAFIVIEDFTKIVPYTEDDISCTFDDPELYQAVLTASSFLINSDPGVSVSVKSYAISNDDRYVYVAKQKWGAAFEEAAIISKQNLDIFGVFRGIDKQAIYKQIVSSDRTFVHLSSKSKDFEVQIGEPEATTAAPTNEELENISTSTYLTEISAGTLSTIINFFFSTGIFEGQRWFPLTIQSLAEENKIKFTVKNTEYTSIPALNIERWVAIDNLDISTEDTISADIVKIFLGLLDAETKIKIYNDPESSGIKFETLDRDLYLAKFS